MQSPEPDYRRVLRETDAKMKQVSGRLQQLHIMLNGHSIEAAVGADWQPLEGVAGCETRLLTNAFVMEARYDAGAEQQEVSVEQAVYGQVSAGRFHLRRLNAEPELITYEPGQFFCLAPNERHAWRAEGGTHNVIVFIPTT